MAAPKGNRFWEARAKHGRDKIFGTPEDLWQAAVEYFQWVEDNPFFEEKVGFNQGEPVHTHIEKKRPMTLGALRIFLGIQRGTWVLYRERKDFMAVCEAVEEVIREHKFAGAASGFFNHAIIARDLGLADKSEITGKDSGPIRTVDETDREIARRIAFVLSKGIKKPDSTPPNGSK